MDIRKWLDEIVYPEHPTSLQSLPLAKSPRQLPHPQPVTRVKPVRNQSRSDSSILELSSGQRRTTRKHRKPTTRAGTAEGAHGEIPVHIGSESSHGSDPTERYVRRPRRKTRPDRYDPSSKIADRDTYVHQSRKDESNQLHRPSKRRRKANMGGGIGHDFRASNVSGHRLTLKPQQQPGIFNKGRASTIAKGRGLPDLVFSEMRFLHKPSEPTCLPRKEEVPKKKHKEDNSRRREGEISAYFSGVRPASVGKGHARPDHPRVSTRDVKPVATRHEQERINMVDGAVPTVEANDEDSYLGLSSRDLCHGSSSYVTWSESLRAQSTTPSRLTNGARSRKDQINAARYMGDEMPTIVYGTSPSLQASPFISRRKENRSTDLFRVSSTDASRHPRSVARCTSTPRGTNAIKKATETEVVGNSRRSSSMSPRFSVHMEVKGDGGEHEDGPKDANHSTGSASYTSCTSCTNKMHSHPQRGTRAEDELSDAMPCAFSDLATTLQQCNDTFQPKGQPTRTQNARSGRRGTSHSARRVERRSTTLDADSTTHGAARVRYANGESKHIDEDGGKVDGLDGYCDGEDGYFSEEDGMASNLQTWEELPTEPSGCRHGFEAGEFGVCGGVEAEGYVQHVASGDSVVAAGFWRPNRLY